MEFGCVLIQLGYTDIIFFLGSSEVVKMEEESELSMLALATRYMTLNK